MMTYTDFVASKALSAAAVGIDRNASDLAESLFPFQRALVSWALHKGRAAIFADTGLGKTRMQLAWAREIPGPVLILAPLAVAQQTVAEAGRMGMRVEYSRSGTVQTSPITITNYEMLHAFDPTGYAGVVLDESSCLRNYAGTVTNQLIDAFAATPYRLVCTATPAPNDVQEFATQSEFLGAMTRREMLAAFFIHDDEGWRLKGHAREPFYRWLSSWGMAIHLPGDIGFDNTGYDLPPLSVQHHVVAAEYVPDGQLFAIGLHGISDRAKVRRGTRTARIAATVALVAAEPDESWICWCGLNDESTELTAAIPGAVEVTGSMTPEEKASRLLAFASGETRVMVTKAAVAGYGMNFQRCARQVFVGLDDSWERYYQAIRRSWRFGQQRRVNVHIVVSDLETPVLDNVLRKERDAEQSRQGLIRAAAGYAREEIAGIHRDNYHPAQSLRLPSWLGETA